MTYGSAATIWRINKGWRRRKEQEVLGFVLDIERGYWQKNDQELEADADDPMSHAHGARRPLCRRPSQLSAA